MPDTSHRVAGPAPTGPGRQHNVPVTVTGETARPRWTLLVLPAVVALCLAATIALDVATPASGPGVELAPGYGWSYGVLGLLLAGLATVVLLHDVRQRFGWALAWLGVFWVLDALAQSYVRYGVRPDDALPGINAALWFLDRFGAFLPVTVAVLLMIFPTGRFLEGRWGRGLPGRAGADVPDRPAHPRRPVRSTASATSTSRPGVDLDAGTLPIPVDLADRAVPVGRRSSRWAGCWSRWPRWWSGTAAPWAWSATGCAGCSGR